MRLTTIHAVNVLSFEDVTVEVDAPLTVIVGPNGAGKTNVFRVVRQVLEALRVSDGLPTQEAWDAVMGTIRAWRRHDEAVVTLEVGVRWDRAEEQTLLAAFVRGVLVNMHDMVRYIAAGSSTEVDATAWAAWVDALPTLVPETAWAWLFEGTLGVQYHPDGELVAYYRPAQATDWLVILRPQSGIVRKLPTARLSSYGQIPLTSLWMQSLAADDLAAVQAFFTKDGPRGGEVPIIPFPWRDLIAQVPAAPRKPQNPGHVIPLVIEAASGAPLPAMIAALYAQVGLLNPSQQGITLLRVVNRLLVDRIVISEDLLSPPAEWYAVKDWARHAEPLTSRHLGAHLLALKVGDDASRVRFAAIQQTFRTLTDRALDVTWTPASGSGQSSRITVVQRGKTDRRSFPLVYSGSGLVEMAYLSALWHLPSSQVLLLDEPGRSLHPQALVHVRQLLEQRTKIEPQRLLHEAEGSPPPSQQPADGVDGAQILAITHSAFVVPTTNLGAVRHLRRRSTGATEAWALPAEDGQPDGPATKRQDRWGRSINWPALLFSSIVLLVEGQTEAAALPLWYERTFGTTLDASGITLLWVGSKTAFGVATGDLDQFHIPWVALVDGDSLKPGSDNIWRQLQRAGRLCKPHAGWAQRWMFPHAVCTLRERYGVFVAGSNEHENFDSVIECLFQESDLPPALQVEDRQNKNKPKVLRALWAAQHVSAPPVVAALFARVRAVAHGERPD